jgi:cell wall-associated NlpC family hydrolase
MGTVPHNVSHQIHRRPWHGRVAATHTLRLFRHGVAVGGSAGWGMSAHHGDARPARLQRADGVYVHPHLPALHHPTIAAEAIRQALHKLGSPYVWAAAGPITFDCSGLVRWAFGHAGIALTHFTGSQWNEGRLIPPADVLPGDLLLFGSTLHHIGIYLGAGWMVNAPYTGHYVDVVPVPHGVAGIVRP